MISRKEPKKEKDKYCIGFVDTENCSVKVIYRLLQYIYNENCVGIYCYGLSDQKSNNTVEWFNMIDEYSGLKEYDIFKSKYVLGKREKNLVDNAIKKDIKKLLNNPNNKLTKFILITGDSDYIVSA